MKLEFDGRQLGQNVTVKIEQDPNSITFCTSREEPDLGSDAAIIQITATFEWSKFAVKIIDFRSDSVKLARAINKVRLAEKHSSDLLNIELVASRKQAFVENWPKFFGLNAKVSLGKESGSRGSWPVIILHDAEESMPNDGMLAVTRFTTGTGIGAFTYRQDPRNNSWLKTTCTEGSGDTNHFAIVTFTDEYAPVMIIHRTISDDKLIMTDVVLKNERRIIQRTANITSESWIEGSSDDDDSISTCTGDEVAEGGEVTSGEITDDTTNSIETLLEEEAEKLGLSKKEIDLLEGVGYGTVKKLANADHEIIAQGTQIKKSRAAQLVKAALTLIN